MNVLTTEKVLKDVEEPRASARAAHPIPSRETTPENPDAVTQRERELGAIVSAYNDVTDRLKQAHEQLNCEVSRLHEELRRKNDELRRRERLAALGEMAAGLAHEVRNPLGGIALYASMLESHLKGNPAARSAAKRITLGVRELDKLVTEILDFAQEGRLECKTCVLREVLEEIPDRVAPWIDECQGRVVIDAPAEGLAVYCDPVRLRQVLVNLLINGLQAAGKGGQVVLSACRPTDGDETRIEVRDNGPGIPAENLDRVFNPFFTTRASGTGLGLAIVHRIVEAHGGTIRAGNRPEGGAAFVIRLPPGP